MNSSSHTQTQRRRELGHLLRDLTSEPNKTTFSHSICMRGIGVFLKLLEKRFVIGVFLKRFEKRFVRLSQRLCILRGCFHD